jgi:NADH-quinone oxidoreductase subunit H
MKAFLLNLHYTVTFAVIYAVVIILLIIAIAFFTVLERKVLAAIQRRRGPNMVGFWGLLQAFADGIKLLAKEPIIVSGANYYIFLLAPIFLFAMSVTLWILIPLPGFQYGVNTTFSFVVVFLFSALNSFAIILAGLASNSRYSLIGGVRAIAQLISYELPLSVSLLTLFCIQGSYSLYDFAGSKIIFAAIAIPTIMIFFISLLAETNRTPFDLPEAEAELVAGYNLEYSSILFSLFFLAEYSNILLATSLMSVLLFKGALFYFGMIFFCLVIIFVRATVPRYTFAQLIKLCWCSLLPASIMILLFTTIMMYFFNLFPSSSIRPEMVELAEKAIAAAGLEKHSVIAGFIAPCAGAKSASACGCEDTTSAEIFRMMNSSLTKELFADPVPAANIIIFFVVAFSMACALVGFNWVVVNIQANNRKNSPYECGFEPAASPIADFKPNFTAVALIFLIYDVEVLLTFPWAYSLAGKTAGALAVFIVYLFIMLLGLMYEVLDESFTTV